MHGFQLELKLEKGTDYGEKEELKTSYLKLIKLTKEFLILKKEEEDAISIVSLIRNARISESIGQSLDILLMKMPLNLQQFIRSSGSLEEAERRALERVNVLREKMDELSPEIRKLSAHLGQILPVSYAQQEQRDTQGTDPALERK